MKDLPALPLPEGIKSARVTTASGLDQHFLCAGDSARPVLLLLHGFPELAFSWRRVMPMLAAAGYYVVAPDQRGYGRTAGWDGSCDGDLSAFSLPNLVRDAVAFLDAIGAPAHAVIGHDFGAMVTAWAALIRPDAFPRAVMMSAPFAGPPPILQRVDPVHDALLRLDPPRRHYQQYYATREAAGEMLGARQGFAAFLRAYFHMKSADWPNRPRHLAGWNAAALAELPPYYIMRADRGMAETVAPEMPEREPEWLPDADLAVYAAEFSRTGLQGALNWYRCRVSPRICRDLSVHAGRRIEVPATFIAGAGDWGWAQVPGALSAMETTATTDWRGTHLIAGAGHWVQQEQPTATVRHILEFLAAT